ncbi:MAG: surface-adhesin E family protein [Novosphingobium sp.]|uniref:surface-adhesin E family protein n=1 Tax=Novosphingobium sp. TaxID=1874826 RepID=UPI003B9B1D2B
MTFRRNLLFPMALLGFSGGAVAEGNAARGWSADWKVIGVAQDRTEVLVRPASIRELPPSTERTFTVRQVWAGFDFAGAASLDTGRKLVLFRYDCTSQRVLIAAATDYAPDGAVLARNTVEADRADRYEPVEPETLNATIMAEACAA